MTVELITGQGGTDHINSEDVGAFQAYTFGPGRYVLNGCECTVVDSNTVRVSKGELLIDGRHVRVKGSEDIAIRSGASGQKRNDLIVVRYTKDSNNIEDAPLTVIPGTATAGSASDPAYVVGSILAEDVEAECPLYRIPIDGLAVGEPVLLMDRQGPFVGHKHSADEINGIGLKAYPVGAYYISESATSPASLFGGTWTQVTGRFLRAANDTADGRIGHAHADHGAAAQEQSVLVGKRQRERRVQRCPLHRSVHARFRVRVPESDVHRRRAIP